MKVIRIKLTGKYILDADTRLPRIFDDDEARSFCEGRDDLVIIDYPFETVNGGLKP